MKYRSLIRSVFVSLTIVALICNTVPISLAATESTDVTSEKVAEYTVAVSEEQLAYDLELTKDAVIASATLNGVRMTSSVYDAININAVTKFGAQGRLMEIYLLSNGEYEIVMKDQYLATVTQVTNCEYSSTGNLLSYATLELVLYLEDGELTSTLTSKQDWPFSNGDTLLVYFNCKNETVQIIGYAPSMLGAQSATTSNPSNSSHIINDVEYPDAIQFNHDETGACDTGIYTWYFDSYGNLIGSKEVPSAITSATYGVISSIYWKDSNNGDNGYAVASITYPDGTSENSTVYAIDGVVLEGVDGKSADYENGYVSSTKQYNKAEFTNRALYKVLNSSNGLKLISTDTLDENTTITTGEILLNEELSGGSSTQFLVWNGKTYESYAGIKNVPTYNGTVDGFYADAYYDGVADVVFLIDPQEATDIQTVLYYINGHLTKKTYLKNNTVSYYTLTGGYVNGEKEIISFAPGNEDLMNEVCESRGVLLVLTIQDGYVVGCTTVTNTPVAVGVNGVIYYAIYADSASDAKIVDDILIPANGNFYNIEDSATITYNYDLNDTLETDGNSFLYLVYEKNNAVQTVYITDTEGMTEEDVCMNLSYLTMYMNDATQQLSVVGTDESAQWTSSNTNVVSVDQNGVVTAVKPGTATITAEVGDYTITCVIAVQLAHVSIEGISLADEFLQIPLGNETTLEAIITPTNASNKTLTWISEDESVATVSETGVVTTLAEGVTTIRVTTLDGGYEASIIIEVTTDAQMGDINRDGDIDSADALIALRAAVGLTTLTDEQSAVADVNGDGSVDAGDAIKILRYDAGLIDSLS